MVVNLFSGKSALIVGVEEDPGGLAVRVYVGHRARGRYFLVSEPEAVAAIRRAWQSSGHVVVNIGELGEVGIGPLDEKPRS